MGCLGPCVCVYVACVRKCASLSPTLPFSPTHWYPLFPFEHLEGEEHPHEDEVLLLYKSHQRTLVLPDVLRARSSLLPAAFSPLWSQLQGDLWLLLSLKKILHKPARLSEAAWWKHYPEWSAELQSCCCHVGSRAVPGLEGGRSSELCPQLLLLCPACSKKVKLSLHCCCFSHFWADWVLEGWPNSELHRVFRSRYEIKSSIVLEPNYAVTLSWIPVPKVVCSYSEQTYAEKVYVFSFREAARSKPQIFKVVRQEWPFEALSSRALVSRFWKLHSLFMELFSGAMAFHCLCTMCGIEDFIKLVQGSQVQAALCQTALVSRISCLRIL